VLYFDDSLTSFIARVIELLFVSNKDVFNSGRTLQCVDLNCENKTEFRNSRHNLVVCNVKLYF